ncbi:uncharacterized protein LOC118434754 [Folsomia candida]|uniref:uncharacterized protein LOC118434754 n=1 Tax=Folsomia candida TaxID=158441 RepID=UPI001604A28D|nr:uncharacterized protein LOC118434754 [Folsomia candida]XP_035704801.1 uncharacterized protein LOC118434754 [Folsomia candida]
MDSNPLIKDHILAMASTTSRRPFHFLQDPSIPCPIDHSYPGQPYSAMIHPDRDMITEVFLDKSKKEESANQSSEKESDTDDVFLSEYVEEDEDESMPDKSTSPRTTSTLISNQFLAALPFQRQSRNHSCGMNAVNNFTLRGSIYGRDVLQSIVANLEAEEQNVVDTGEVDPGAYGSELGDYNVVVLEQALIMAQYQVSRRSIDFDIDASIGFIYNPGNHWIAVRRVQDQCSSTVWRKKQLSLHHWM